VNAAQERVTTGLNRAVFSDHLRNLLSRHGITRVLDVGGWHGGYGSLLRGIGFEGQIASVEPVAESFEELQAAAAGDERWSAHHLALGERDGEAEIGVAASRDFSSLLPASAGGERLTGSLIAVERTEAVELRRLDSAWDELVPEGEGGLLLKLDTQGYDWHVIEGAGPRLAEVTALQLEAPVQELYEGMVGWLELLGRLQELGFAPSGVFPVTRDARLCLVEVDLTLVRVAA
jgi:FkbM family methyltransferase